MGGGGGGDYKREKSSSEEQPVDDSSSSPKFSDTSIKFSHRVPTPIEICRGLDEYVIGQPNVKMALSVGVYNHYKRIVMAEANALKAAVQKNVAASLDKDGMNMVNIKLSTTGSNTATTSSAGPTAQGVVKGYCEASTNAIPSTDDDGSEYESCEIDKSNIIIIGPTGSGEYFYR